MTVRELAAALAALPEEWQGLDVFSTADWAVVDGIEDRLTEFRGVQCVEITGL